MNESREISLPARIEAILYLKGRPTSSKEMADLLDKDIADVEKALWELKAGYAQRDTALEINESKNHYSLELRQGLGELVQDLLPADLSIATLRTLATVALKKKILQSDLVDLRGSGAYDHIKELVENLLKIIDFKGSIFFNTEYPDGNPRKLLDSTKINNFGWKPKISIDEGLSKTYKWYLENIY